MKISKKISAIVCADCNDEDEQSVIEFGIGISAKIKLSQLREK